MNANTSHHDIDDLPMKRVARALLLAFGLVSGGCLGAHTKDADTLARTGDWETALIQYRIASAAHPNEMGLYNKIDHAEEKVVAIWTKRGFDSNEEGRLGDAGEWWRRAIDLQAERVEEGRAFGDPKEMKAWKAIVANMSALEYYGDVAVAEERHEDAIGVFGAILRATPERVDLVEKHLAAKRAFAGELFTAADGLKRRDLLGAALVSDLRALQHDPMQPQAFHDGTELRRALRARTRIALQDEKVEDKGFKALGAGIGRKMTAKLGDFAPYGPTRDPLAKKAAFKVTIEEFARNESTQEGEDPRPNTIAPSTVPVENPAIAVQTEVVKSLERDLALHQKALKTALAEKARRNKKPIQGAPVVDDAGLAAARALDKTRAELDAAKATLAALPAKVAPPAPPATWSLAWKETTRTVEARVRFEITESEFAEPVTMVITHRAQRTDRSHAGNAPQGVEADPLVLPSFEELTGDLSAQFADGATVIDQARARRVGALVERGRADVKNGREEEALDAFVTVIFMAGPAALPEDAAAFLSRRLEHDRLKEIAAIN